MAASPHITKKIDLHLAVLCAVKQPDETLTCADIAEICECSVQLISRIQIEALAKLKRKISNHKLGDYV